MDYIDPFSIIEADENPANNVKIYKTLNKHIENKVNNLSTNIFILEESYRKFLNSFPNTKKKITVIPPMLGIDEEKYKKVCQAFYLIKME